MLRLLLLSQTERKVETVFAIRAEPPYVINPINFSKFRLLNEEKKLKY